MPELAMYRLSRMSPSSSFLLTVGSVRSRRLFPSEKCCFCTSLPDILRLLLPGSSDRERAASSLDLLRYRLFWFGASWLRDFRLLENVGFPGRLDLSSRLFRLLLKGMISTVKM